MLYLEIDLHRAQMTVSLRNENGDVILRNKVSTRWRHIAWRFPTTIPRPRFVKP